jgi:hypothetical protein
VSPQINIQDVGPIHHLSFGMDGPGGVIVFKGRNGVGKTHAINASAALADPTRARSMTSRDGSGRGTISGLGVELGIGRRTTARGELEVTQINADDPSELVNPGYKDDAVADEHRLKVLCRLARVRPNAAWFAKLVGGEDELKAIAKPTTLALLESDNLPGLAEAMRRDLQAAARTAESEHQNFGHQASALIENTKDVDTSGPSDERVLSDLHADASRQVVRLEERRAAQDKADRERAQALAQIAEAQQPEDLAQIEREHEQKAGLIQIEQDQQVAIDNRVAQLRSEIAELTRDRDECGRRIESLKNERAHLEQRAVAASRHAGTVAKWHETIAKTNIPDAERVLDKDLEEARAVLANAGRAIEQGAIVRRVLKQRADSESLADRARAAEKRADALRDAAKGVDEVISESLRAIAPRGFGVTDGRLVIDTDRGRELYTQLSDGERWRFALDVTIDAVGEGGILAIRQEAWEGLDPYNRASIAVHARERSVWILTAEADGGELRAEQFVPGEGVNGDPGDEHSA